LTNGSPNSHEPYLLSEKLGSGLTADVYMCRESQFPFTIVGAMKVFKHQKYAAMAEKEA
jgi:hypothetical protein